jgi:hypothetical protein
MKNRQHSPWMRIFEFWKICGHISNHSPIIQLILVPASDTVLAGCRDLSEMQKRRLSVISPTDDSRNGKKKHQSSDMTN